MDKGLIPFMQNVISDVLESDDLPELPQRAYYGPAKSVKQLQISVLVPGLAFFRCGVNGWS